MRWATLTLVLAIIPVGAGDAVQLRIPYEHFRLRNGLDVVLVPDSTKAFATVAVGYRTGARDDPEWGRGLAHLVEHLVLASDSRNVTAKTRTELTEGSGGMRNGFTSHDTTWYVNSVRASAIERVLWFEADVMSALSDSLDESTLKREIAVIENEGLQKSRPSGPLLAGALYPEGHPYGTAIVGDVAQLRGLERGAGASISQRALHPG